MHGTQENSSPKVAAESSRERFISTEEKAQYEVFATGTLPREVIEKWIKNDLTAILAFVHNCLRDEKVFNALVDANFERYKVLHSNKVQDESSRS